ncbi:dockerin type I domain-containing protein [Planctomycetota bacterium]
MVLYTPAALQGAGSVQAIETEIQDAVDVLNRVFVNSGVPAEANVVYKAEIDYANDAPSAGNVFNAAEWILLNTVALRDDVGADAVVVLVEHEDGPTLGITATSFPLPHPFQASAVVRRFASGSKKVFAHEMGHQLGCDHEPLYTSGFGASAFPYSFGHGFPDPSNTNNTIGTLMALDADTRLEQFSSPSRSYNGISLGIANQRDNELTAVQTAITVAGYRTFKTEYPWKNPTNKYDVSEDGYLSPVDALRVINALNSGIGSAITPGGGPLRAYAGSVASQRRVDTTGDNYLSPRDALLVINQLNAESEAEGEPDYYYLEEDLSTGDYSLDTTSYLVGDANDDGVLDRTDLELIYTACLFQSPDPHGYRTLKTSFYRPFRQLAVLVFDGQPITSGLLAFAFPEGNCVSTCDSRARTPNWIWTAMGVQTKTTSTSS